MTNAAQQEATREGSERGARCWPLLLDIAQFAGIGALFYAPWAFLFIR